MEEAGLEKRNEREALEGAELDEDGVSPNPLDREEEEADTLAGESLLACTLHEEEADRVPLSKMLTCSSSRMRCALSSSYFPFHSSATLFA